MDAVRRGRKEPRLLGAPLYKVAVGEREAEQQFHHPLPPPLGGRKRKKEKRGLDTAKREAPTPIILSRRELNPGLERSSERTDKLTY